MEWKKLVDPFLLGMAALVAAVYLIIPLTNDARIYLGVEHIAANFYPFPQGIDLAWEIKPVANRLTNYFLYKIASFFVPFDNHFLFGFAVKVLALIAVIAVAYYFSRVIRQKYAFLLVFFSFTAMANFCILQAEYWAALLSVAAIAMLVSERRAAWALAGCLGVWIFLLKGITGLLIVPILCGAYLLIANEDELSPLDMVVIFMDNIKRVSLFVAGAAAAAVFFFLMWIFYWPHMISDMVLSSSLARVGMNGAVNLGVWFFAQLVMSPLYIPVLFIGLIFGIIFYFAWVRRQSWDLNLAYLLMWLVPAAIVLIQGEMFLYHYLVFVPAAIVTVTMCERVIA